MKIWIVMKQEPHGQLKADQAFTNEESAKWHANKLVQQGGGFVSIQTTLLVDGQV